MRLSRPGLHARAIPAGAAERVRPQPVGPVLIRKVHVRESSATTPGRILVVEDLEHNRELFRTVLARAGYVVETAPDGRAAVAALQAGAFDLVLMDIQMPVLDGLSATREIRKFEGPARDVTIVGMSANVLPEQLRAFEAAGMDDHLGKPFRRAQLLEKVAAWLGRPAGLVATSGPVSRDVVPDAAALSTDLDELVGLMGRDWVLTGLGKLVERIDETFSSDEPSDPRLVARQAHALVSQSALVGFRGFADACSTLEEICLRGQDPRGAYRTARDIALAVRREAERLRATR